MADKTAIFESAQALFCAMADYIGTPQLKKELNLKKYPTYKDFKSVKKNKVLIDRAFQQTRLVGVSLKQVETLLEDKTWYESSVLIAVKLLDDITKINAKFGKIQDAKWQDFFYVRGARGGTTAMDNIDNLFKYANKNDKKFGDINKWSPADIYFVSDAAREEVQEQTDEANINESYTFLQLNRLCNNLIKRGELLPLSLKKVIDGSPVIVKYNFNRSADEKLFSQMVYIETKKSKTGRDIQIIFKDARSQLKIRHDPHDSKFGATKTIKTEILVSSAGGRLGSIGSMDILLSVIKDAGLKSGDKLAANLKEAFDKGYKSYARGINQLNEEYGVTASDSHSTLSADDYEEYKEDRAKISQKRLMAKIIPVIDDYFKTHKRPKTKDSFSDSTMMVQAFIKYASSRSPMSGKFVIAK